MAFTLPHTIDYTLPGTTDQSLEDISFTDEQIKNAVTVLISPETTSIRLHYNGDTATTGHVLPADLPFSHRVENPLYRIETMQAVRIAGTSSNHVVVTLLP